MTVSMHLAICIHVYSVYLLFLYWSIWFEQINELQFEGFFFLLQRGEMVIKSFYHLMAVNIRKDASIFSLNCLNSWKYRLWCPNIKCVLYITWLVLRTTSLIVKTEILGFSYTVPNAWKENTEYRTMDHTMSAMFSAIFYFAGRNTEFWIMTKQKIIIDCDTGVDDAQAIMMALSRPDTDVIGITCVNGNVDIENVCRNTLRVLKICDALHVF